MEKDNVQTNKLNEIKIYYDNAKTKLKKHYFEIDGKLHGEDREFLESGQLISITTYLNGIKSGPYSLFYSSGQLFITHNFINGKVEGVGKVYYQNGILKNILNFTNGNPKGESIIYDEIGNEISRTSIP